ncbi:MAG: hypothetical protein KatS3mg115_0107 [Candidatus Poribacteria bacterium]|nr:MAG: hypothetical protein KatS3mg115_0107 [Candidatus Poribacteria bacterium]
MPRWSLGRLGAVLVLGGLFLFGCAQLEPLLTTNWTENFALADLGTRATDPAIIDGNPETVGQTPPQADPRIFLIEFPEPKTVRRIRILNDNLYRFRVEYWDTRRGDWRTLKTVWQRRDVEGDERIVQPIYDIRGINFTTDKIRLVVTRTVDDRIVAKVAPDRDDKILDHVRQVIGNTWVEYYKIIVELPARVREVEVYGVASG